MINRGEKIMKTTTTFQSCGLDIKYNIFNAPKGFIFETDQDVVDFMYTILEAIKYNYVGIFAITQDNRIIVGHKSEDEIQCGVAEAEEGIETSKDKVENIIARCQEEMGYSCYGLLEQVDDNIYAIVMD